MCGMIHTIENMIYKLKKVSIHILGMNPTWLKYDSYLISMIHTEVFIEIIILKYD